MSPIMDFKTRTGRAMGAIRQAQPFNDLRPKLYGRKITVTLNASKACASR
jgi:hypothetical protein